MSGCAICVYDLYEESLAAYRDAVNTLRQSLTAVKVPESEWPVNLRTTMREAATKFSESKKEITLSAFKELEQALALKMHKRVEEEARS